MTSKAKQQEREEAIIRLRAELAPGDTVYTVLRHRSASGMSRSISCVIIKDNKPLDISWLVARALDYRIDDKNDGIKVGGAGMDMGFHVVYSLGYTLFPDGFDCIGEGCPSNDHTNYWGAKDRAERDGLPVPEMPTRHESGGYALNHRWL